jgi:UDP-GlcNAc3NAcA epimerase
VRLRHNLNHPMTVLTVVGARPQFIKAAPVHRAMKEAGIREILVHTGQHHDAAMSDVFFTELGLDEPDFNLGISGGGHGEMTGRMLGALEKVLTTTPCDAVLVYGDTNSTLAGALAAAKLGIPIIHQEAGLRSFNRAMPEEINRVVTDHAADLLLAPTRQAIKHLVDEGLGARAILVGDVMLDVAIEARQRADQLAASGRDILADLGLNCDGHAIMTLHRAESTKEPRHLARLIDACLDVALGRPIIFPVHPRTQAVIEQADLKLSASIRQIAPVGYVDMTRLVSTADVVLTDSGGLQKEAYFHRVPCVTLRSETEWPETIICGWNRLWSEPAYAPRCEITEYGSGQAAKASVDAIRTFLQSRLGRSSDAASHLKRSANSTVGSGRDGQSYPLM